MELRQIVYGEPYIVVQLLAFNKTAADKISAVVDKYKCIAIGVDLLQKKTFFYAGLLRITILVPENKILEFSQER